MDWAEEGFAEPKRLLTFADIEHVLLTWPSTRADIEALYSALRKEFGLDRD
jgi:hypothetical protein